MGKKILFIAIAATGLSSSHAAVISDLPDSGLLSPLVILNNDINLSNVTVDGYVGVSANGDLQPMAPSTVQDFLPDSTVNYVPVIPETSTYLGGLGVLSMLTALGWKRCKKLVIRDSELQS